MTDIVERLRNDAYALPSNGDWIERNGDTIPNNSLSQAADEIEFLRQQIAELEDDEQKAVDCCVIAEQRLAECQARNVVLRNHLRWHIRVYRVTDDAWSPEADCDRLMEKEVGLPSDSNALDALKKQWEREALLEAVQHIRANGGLTYGLENKAKELE